MLKNFAAILLVICASTPALAQSGSYYDYRNGNMYNWNTGPSGTHVFGNNFNTGSTWQNNIMPNGNQNGIDSGGNFWNYNAATGSYMNSNGHGCIGSGYARSCW
jgi:hypothetical protein